MKPRSFLLACFLILELVGLLASETAHGGILFHRGSIGGCPGGICAAPTLAPDRPVCANAANTVCVPVLATVPVCTTVQASTTLATAKVVSRGPQLTSHASRFTRQLEVTAVHVCECQWRHRRHPAAAVASTLPVVRRLGGVDFEGFGFKFHFDRKYPPQPRPEPVPKPGLFRNRWR